MPVCMHILYESSKGTQIDTLLPDTLLAITSLCSQLPWSHYFRLLKQVCV